MKFHSRSPEVKFEPRDVTITIETQEELDFLRYFVGLNITLPNVVLDMAKHTSEANPEQYKRLTKALLDGISKEIN